MTRIHTLTPARRIRSLRLVPCFDVGDDVAPTLDSGMIALGTDESVWSGIAVVFGLCETLCQQLNRGDEGECAINRLGRPLRGGDEQIGVDRLQDLT